MKENQRTFCTKRKKPLTRKKQGIRERAGLCDRIRGVAEGSWIMNSGFTKQLTQLLPLAGKRKTQRCASFPTTLVS